jgi:aspartate aminotransferase
MWGRTKIEGLSLLPPEGAFYAYIGCGDLIARRTPKGEVLTDDVAVSNYLLAEAHVSSVPGAAYGLSPFFRISTATSDEILEEAIARIGRAVATLRSAEAAE